MSRRFLIALIIALMGISFLAGAWISFRPSSSVSARKILRYVDPMHPSYTSDKPGIAPDCGMALEPVYADGTTDKSATSLPPGTIQVAPERLQQIGVKTGTVERSGDSQTLRLPGRVAPDERRLYVINSTIDGWITGVRSSTTGSQVKKNEVLASFYSPEFLSAAQALLFALNSMDRTQAGGAANLAQQGQMDQYTINLKQYRDSLRNLGMGDEQVNEMIRTRKFMENVDITAPGDGFLISRSVSAGQRFERGKELFRIADLSKVWILVDTYGTESEQLKPGQMVTATLPGKNRRFQARVSSVLPQFDPASRTLKVRLEANNPGFHLRPDMFVDVELPVRQPSMLAIPNEAVLDSGLKKTVFIEKGNGVFEPREVTTGRSFGTRVEILSGLKVGEKIAISGTFLLDSESRMRTAAAGITGPATPDPVCGMYVDEARAKAKGLIIEREGKTLYFCSLECQQKAPMPGATKSTSATPAKGKKPAGDEHPAAHATPPAATPPKPAEHAEHQAPPAPAARPQSHDGGGHH